MKPRKTLVCGLAVLAAFALICTACPDGNGNNGRGGSVNYAMVRVPGGSFQMGQNGDGTSGNVTPVHTVTLTGFSIGMK